MDVKGMFPIPTLYELLFETTHSQVCPCGHLY
jgi:hypothetical protein